MDDAIVVTVTGIGQSTAVELLTGSTLGDALAKANIDTERAGLNVRVNGQTVSADEPIENGSQVTVTPKDTKLGF